MLDDPIHVGGHTLHVSVSTGGVIIDGDLARDEILSNADAAMYSAKDIARSGWVFFDADLRRQASDRLRIEAHARDGIGIFVVEAVFDRRIGDGDPTQRRGLGARLRQCDGRGQAAQRGQKHPVSELDRHPESLLQEGA